MRRDFMQSEEFCVLLEFPIGYEKGGGKGPFNGVSFSAAFFVSQSVGTEVGVTFAAIEKSVLSMSLR